MAQRYWSDADHHWPEGHPYDHDSGRFPGMDAARAGAPRAQPQPGRARRMARAYLRSDTRIRDEVCERLAHSNAVDPGEVTVEVRDGVVTLEGTVPLRPMRYALEDIAAQCLGVVEVDNRVRVAGTAR